MSCPVRKKPRGDKKERPVASVPAGPKKAASALTRIPKTTRKDLDEACERLQLVTFADVRWRLANLLGKTKPTSRQHVYNLIARHELVQGISLAHTSTITRASFDSYVRRLEASRA